MAGSPTNIVSEASQSGRKRRLWFIRTSFTLLLVFSLVAGVRALTLKEVSIHLSNGRRITVTTAAMRVGTALDRAGVQLFDGDLVTPSLDTPIRKGDVITVKRAFSVEISVDGKLLDVRTAGATVQALLGQAGVKLGKDDKVTPALSKRIDNESIIHVVRVTFGYTTTDEAIPFKIIRRSDPTMDRGKTRVARNGVNGVLRHTIKVTYDNGKVTKRSEVKREVAQAPVDSIIYVGSRIVPKVIETSGGFRQYTAVKTMLATAYLPGDGVTSTGLQAKRGVVAVDPRVIPLGTRVYIPGYGEAIAADTGGAIKGLRIDLCYESRRDALKFGRRPVKVYILAKR